MAACNLSLSEVLKPRMHADARGAYKQKSRQVQAGKPAPYPQTGVSPALRIDLQWDALDARKCPVIS